MSTCFIRRLAGIRIQLANAAAALAAPSAGTDGVAVPSSWKIGPAQSRLTQIAIEIIGDPLAAVALTTIAVWGYDGTTWWRRGTFGDLTTPATGGASFFVNDIAADERIAISAATVGAPVDVFATPYFSESY